MFSSSHVIFSGLLAEPDDNAVIPSEHLHFGMILIAPGRIYACEEHARKYMLSVGGIAITSVYGLFIRE